MRLLICTQAVDTEDPILGFFHRWVEEFAKHSERVHVICLKEGAHHLPPNVSVHSLGKEGKTANSEQRTANRISYVIRFYFLIWKYRNEYDTVFVHMNPEYVLFGGLLWRLWRKRIVLWYVHRQSTFALRLAASLVQKIATSAKGSIGLRSPKIAVVGHGIDTDAFSGPVRPLDKSAPKIVTVGRISPIKSLHTIVEAVGSLREHGIDASLDIIGPTIYEGDLRYKTRIEDLIRERNLADRVRILPAVPNSRMPELYSSYDIAVNACPAGGIDKAVLEAMAAGEPVFVANESVREYLGNHARALIFRFEDHADLAQKIRTLLSRNDIPSLQNALRVLVRERADVGRCISAIMQLYARHT